MSNNYININQYVFDFKKWASEFDNDEVKSIELLIKLGTSMKKDVSDLEKRLVCVKREKKLKRILK